MDQNKEFTSGAKSSHGAPRYDLIPQEGLKLIAERFEEGLKKYSRDNWRQGEFDGQFRVDRLNHAIEHLMKYRDEMVQYYEWLEKTKGMDGTTQPFTTLTENHLGAIGWFVCVEAFFNNKHGIGVDDIPF